MFKFLETKAIAKLKKAHAEAIKEVMDNKYQHYVDQIDSLEEEIEHDEKDHAQEIKDKDQTHQFEIKGLKKEHELALKQKDYDLEHHKDGEIKAMEEKVVEAEKKQAVLEVENKMLEKIVNVDADLIDIKDIINKLIDKMPEVNLSSISVNVPAETKK